MDDGGCTCDEILEDSTCASSCFNGNGSFNCGCNTGYELAADALTCTGKPVLIALYAIAIFLQSTQIPDVDECALDSEACGCDPALSENCTARCENLFGSFQCVCPDGYSFEPESQTCEGKARHASVLWYIVSMT